MDSALDASARLAVEIPRREMNERRSMSLNVKIDSININAAESNFQFVMDTVMIDQADTAEEIAIAREIFREYESWLGLDLCFQGFEQELKDLPGRYAAPNGRLFLARADDDIAGAVALRPLEPGICEMKRLFVREAFRGMGIGQSLIDHLITEARAIGYTAMRLDTYPPKMGKAVRLYESYGFREIPPYYDNPTDGVLYMELKLQ